MRTPTAKSNPTKKDGNINCLRSPTSTSLHGDLKRGDPFARGYHTRERTDHRSNDPTYIFNSNHHYCVEKKKKSVSHVNFFGVKGRSSSSVGYSVGYKHILSMSSSLCTLLCMADNFSPVGLCTFKVAPAAGTFKQLLLLSHQLVDKSREKRQSRTAITAITAPLS